ncbi:D-alanine--D-alanine ligase [Echinicola jeungdonensis]|uniref:D-alanine--D-alanine ligase n=1 Tax=Echinicola jeungdonensis TaxID=709343 RepID=A0ABV5J539_9BACT|nr:D-alanine--D-alanine ligase [Echinicola jeungdonensis]MDN3668621.1 D-alanine--D-alanine ligase [Echinicola jeungdonensis]
MKKKIALVTGGFTGEAKVSLKSAAVVEKNIDLERYDVYKIIINREKWCYQDASGKEYKVDLNDFSISLNGEKIQFDGVFNILHGSPGEDGKLSGYFDMLGIPYTTSSTLTSAITMNKGYTKAIVEGIDDLFMAKSFQLFENSPENTCKVAQELSMPCFVKPNNGGSSIGMSKVKKVEELQDALDLAFGEDDQVLVEEFVSGREFSIGIYKIAGEIIVLPSTEIVSSKEYFDFEAKYTAGVSEEITPGRMTPEEVIRVSKIAEAVYQKLNCKGAVRMDYFLEKDTGKFYFIEVNTVPGQTETSLISQQVRAVGKTVKEFYTELIEEMWV